MAIGLINPVSDVGASDYETTTPGTISVLDGATSITVFTTGTVTTVPFTIALGIFSVNGAWSVTTGASVSVVAIGRFT